LRGLIGLDLGKHLSIGDSETIHVLWELIKRKKTVVGIGRTAVPPSLLSVWIRAKHP
jgi:hypothetical protein